MELNELYNKYPFAFYEYQPGNIRLASLEVIQASPEYFGMDTGEQIDFIYNIMNFALPFIEDENKPFEEYDVLYGELITLKALKDINNKYPFIFKHGFILHSFLHIKTTPEYKRLTPAQKLTLINTVYDEIIAKDTIIKHRLNITPISEFEKRDWLLEKNSIKITGFNYDEIEKRSGRIKIKRHKKEKLKAAFDLLTEKEIIRCNADDFINAFAGTGEPMNNKIRFLIKSPKNNKKINREQLKRLVFLITGVKSSNPIYKKAYSDIFSDWEGGDISIKNFSPLSELTILKEHKTDAELTTILE